MPLLVLIFLTAACMPEARAEAWLDLDTSTRAIGTAALAAVGMAAAVLLSRRTVRAAHAAADRRAAAVRRYYGTRWALLFVNLGLALAAILLLGWGRVVEETCRVPWRGETTLAPFADLLTAAPYLANVVANWFIYYFAERALTRTAANPARQRFWSLPGFVLFNARQFLLLVLFPVLLLCTQLALTRFLPELLGEWWYQLGTVLGIVALFLVLPRLAKPMLGLKSLPAGPHRMQLEATGKRLRFRRTDLLLWPTRGGAANAMIVGIVPQARYVIFTDALLESLSPPEIDAVFGHEVGHAHHGHLAYYAAFILLSGLAISGVVGVAHELAEQSGAYDAMPPEMRTPLKLAPLLLMGAYLFVVFGWLSRVCERQADIAGARAGSCGDPRCEGHDDILLARSASEGSLQVRLTGSIGQSESPPGDAPHRDPSLALRANKRENLPLCPTGLRAMVMALEVVMGMNGLGGADARRSFAKRWLAWFRSWQHGPADARIGFLQTLMDKPELAARHDRYAYRVRVGIALVLFAVVAATGSYIGWSEVWKLM